MLTLLHTFFLLAERGSDAYNQGRSVGKITGYIMLAVIVIAIIKKD